MTEICLPMPGTTIGDAGPYPVGGATALGWWDKAYLMNRAGGRISQTTLADIGVYYAVDDQLECTVAADTISIDVDTGASLVDGTLHYNDTDPVNVPIPAAGAGDDRIDLVVVRKNYQAAVTYTPGGGAPTVGPRETRITVVRGVESGTPATPTVTQDTTRATYWDIPLYTVQVDDGGTLTSLTDLREYVDAETKRLFVPALVGYNVDDALEIVLDSGYGLGPVIYGSRLIMPDGKECYGIGRFGVPQNYISGMTSNAVVFSSSGGAVFIYIDNQYKAGTCGEDYETHSDSTGLAQVSYATSLVYACVQELDISAVDENDFIQLIFRRDASNVLDTLNADLWLTGFLVEYIGWK